MKRIVMIIMVMWIAFPVSVNAADVQNETQEKIFSQFEFGEIDQLLDDLFPDEKINFKDTIVGLISGDVELSLELLKDMILDQFSYEFRNSKSGMIKILMICIIAAVLHNFSAVFQNNQTANMSFCVLYMLLITVCLESFRVLVDSVVLGIGNLMNFLELLGPIYFLAVAIATGGVTSIAFYNIVLLLIYIVEVLILNVLLPLVQVFMMIRILNDLSAEEYLTKFSELIQTVISWSLKVLLTGVISMNLIQGLLSPAIDSVKRSILTRGGEAIPIVGDAIGGVTEVVLGTAVLIKNGIGVAGTIICIAICASPVIQMAVVALMYKLTAALIQPISDKRMVGCICSMADGATILLKIVLSSCVLFLVSIAMVAATTS